MTPVPRVGRGPELLQQTVQGFVDSKTQRAAWTVGDNKTVVYDTSISNLTKDEAPLLVHVDKDNTQQWLLVRMKKGQQDGDQPSSGSSPGG